MTRVELIETLNRQEKQVRAEYGFTQNEMANVLGLSKKTLVEIEKGRSSLGWMGAVALCTLFPESHVLADSLGGEAGSLIHALAFNDAQTHIV